MDFLNRALGQLNELFRSMTIGARITAALLFATVAISVVWLFRYETSNPDHYLMNGVPLSPGDITAMEAAFAAKGLNSYVIEGNRIRVPRGQKDLYMGAAADKKALPREFGGHMDDALNNQTSILDDRHKTDERIKNARQKELAQIIGRMRGIETASVMIDIESKPGLVRETTKTALVSVKPAGSANLDDSQVDSIRHLVAGAVAGLKNGNVKVVDENSGRTYYGDADGGVGSMGDAYYAAKRRFEQKWASQILSAISYVRGATVGVNVDIEKELRRRETQNKLDPKAVATRKTEKNRSRTRDGSAPGGRVGVEANRPQAIGPSTAKGSHEEEEENSSVEDSVIGSTNIETEMPGLTPTRVTASIGVPMSYFEEIWRKRNPAQPGEEQKKPTQNDLDQIRTQEIANIKSAVVALLPQPDKTTDKPTDLTQFVTVTPFQDIPQEPAPMVGLPERTLEWLVHNWSMLGLIFLGGFSLVVLRSVARSAPAASPRPASRPVSLDLSSLPQRTPELQEAAAAGAAADAVAGIDAAGDRRSRRTAAGGRSLRDELSEIVADDPDAAANVLRTWIGNVR